MNLIDTTGKQKPAPYITPTEINNEKYNWLDPIFKEVRNEEGEAKLTVTACKVNASKLRKKLEQAGFFNHELAGSRFLLRLENGSAEVWTIEQLRDWFDREYIRTFPEAGVKDITSEMLENLFLNQDENLIKKSIANRLRPQSEINFLEHSRTEAIFPYLNGVAVVTEKNITLIPYHKAGGIVFKNNILPRQFKPMAEYEFKEGNWYQFIKHIANGRNNQYNRVDDMITVLGYLMHRYYERKLKSIILMDSRGSAESPKGRGGKTLLGKGLGHMLNADMRKDKVYCEIDGKNFNMKQATKYQEAEVNTGLIHINDVELYGEFAFKLQNVYNDVLEGVKVRKMYTAPFHIKCKIMISANHTFNTESGSTRDRFEEVQLSDCYDEKFSPLDHFGKWFFSTDWTETDWRQFDNTMLYCVQQYLRRGLTPPHPINLTQMKAVHQSNPDFIDFMEQLRENGEIYHECELIKTDLLNRFVQLYPEHMRLQTQQKVWLRWLRAYTHYHDFLEDWTEEKNKEFDTVKRLNSNGSVVRVFRYFYKSEPKTPQNQS